MELDIKYAGYIAKELRAIEKTAKLDSLRVPEGFDFRSVRGLSTEAREKLVALEPRTLGQAARVAGVRQGDIAVLMVALKQKK
ncbi:hypothetical protein MASR2M78_09540 [Treponema sp.]